MIPRTWLLSGVPRSGTSLCCRLADGAPDTVALSEPIDSGTFDGMEDAEEAGARIRDFAEATRRRILRERTARSVQVDGRLDDDRVTAARGAAGLRKPRGGPGTLRVEKPLSAGFKLLIKHNALFAALLGTLAQTFPVVALVRNPVAVLASWQTVDLPVQRGRVPAGERFDAGLRRRLDGESAALQRQLVVLDWFFARFRTHLPRERVLRYEDLVASGGRTLFRHLQADSVAPQTLRSRNANVLYESAMVDALLAAILEEDGAWRSHYSEADCREAAAAIRAHR